MVNTAFIEQELNISLSGHKADLSYLKSESANALSSLVISRPACRVTAYCVLHQNLYKSICCSLVSFPENLL